MEAHLIWRITDLHNGFVGFLYIQLGTDSNRTVVAESLSILTGTYNIETPLRIKMRLIYKKVPHQKLNVLLQGGIRRCHSISIPFSLRQPALTTTAIAMRGVWETLTAYGRVVGFPLI